MKCEQVFFVGAMDVDWQKKLTNRALLEMFSNITMYHGAQVGHTALEGVSPVSWMVMNYKMKVYCRPSMFSHVRVETWISGYSKVRADREYIVRDAQGELICRASAIWVALDGATGNPLRMTEKLMEGFGTDEEKNFPDLNYLNPRKFSVNAMQTQTIQLHRSMDDYNGHVHNSMYLEIAQEALPADLYRGTFGEIEIAYKNEITSGSEVLLEYAEGNGECRIAIRSPEDGRLHGAVVLDGFRSATISQR